MLKKLALPAVAVFALALFAAVPQASARVHFGVTVGAPVYTYPVTPYYDYDYSYAYPAPYVAPYPYYSYSYPRVYTYSRPYYFGGNWGGHERHEWRERLEHERHEYREHHR